LFAQDLQAVLKARDTLGESVGGERAVLEGLVAAVERALGLRKLPAECLVVCFEGGSLVVLAAGCFGYRCADEVAVAVQAH
jgi:hypothetical protein